MDVPTPPRRSLSPAAFRWFALVAFVSMILIVLTGAAVRLTGSGLGCPDWPTCFKHAYTTGWTIHSKIEFANRLVTILLVVVTVVIFLASLARRPRRRDLTALTGLLLVGLVVDAVLGAYVVYSKLNPWLVSLHMIISLAMVVIAAILYHRSKYVYGPGARVDVRDPHFRLIARLLWVPFAALLVTGTMTTGSGPHAGGSEGQLEARRLPFAFSSAARFTWHNNRARWPGSTRWRRPSSSDLCSDSSSSSGAPAPPRPSSSAFAVWRSSPWRRRSSVSPST